MLLGYNLFPIPLVNVDRVYVIKLLVTANGVHIRVKTVANEEVVFLKRKPFPFSKRVHDLRCLPHCGNVKANGALRTA